MRKKFILDEEDYEKNSHCRNCPYFINKIVCPFHRKNGGKERDFYKSGTSQEKINGEGK
jgi:hypothetical protein